MLIAILRGFFWGAAYALDAIFWTLMLQYAWNHLLVSLRFPPLTNGEAVGLCLSIVILGACRRHNST